MQATEGVNFEKPSDKKSREKAEAIRRARKVQLKRIQREHGVDKAGAGEGE